MTVQVGEPGLNSHEVVHHDGQTQGEPHDDVHEEVRVLLVLLLLDQPGFSLMRLKNHLHSISLCSIKHKCFPLK